MNSLSVTLPLTLTKSISRTLLPTRPTWVQMCVDVDNGGTMQAQAWEGGCCTVFASQETCVGGLQFSTIPANELGAFDLTNTLPCHRPDVMFPEKAHYFYIFLVSSLI